MSFITTNKNITNYNLYKQNNISDSLPLASSSDDHKKCIFLKSFFFFSFVPHLSMRRITLRGCIHFYHLFICIQFLSIAPFHCYAPKMCDNGAVWGLLWELLLGSFITLVTWAVLQLMVANKNASRLQGQGRKSQNQPAGVFMGCCNRKACPFL